jgi:hypothetical protein
MQFQYVYKRKGNIIHILPELSMVAMNVPITIQLILLLTIFTATSITACSCYVWPTLDTVLEDESAYLFRGIVVPRLFSTLSKRSAGVTNEYTLRVQKVYKNGCITDIRGKKVSSVLLLERQAVTIVTPRNSCGIRSLPIFRSFLVSGDVTTSDQDRVRWLRQGQDTSTSYNFSTIIDTSNTAIRAHMLRRAASTDAMVTMNANLCNTFIQLWRTVTRTEKNLLSIGESSAVNTTFYECSNGI